MVRPERRTEFRVIDRATGKVKRIIRTQKMIERDEKANKKRPTEGDTDDS